MAPQAERRVLPQRISINPKRRWTMTTRGLDGRDRDKNGQIRAKNGNTHISTLRGEYGPHILPGVPGNTKLDTVLHRTGTPSLSQLLKPQHRKG